MKETTEEQMLLNIVRLRYTDSPSSLGVTAITDQKEKSHSLKLVPFFAASGDANPRPFSTLLPQVEVNGAERPVLTMTPLDDQEFTRKLFTPLPLEGLAYLSRTTWPISVVFRLWLENLNWVSNAETASGPTPAVPPVYEEFLRGMQALQRLQDERKVAFFNEEREETLAEDVPADGVSGRDALEAAKAGLLYRKDAKTGKWALVKKQPQPVLKVRPDSLADPDVQELCRAFSLEVGRASYDLQTEKVDPYLSNKPPRGLTVLDMESRSLLQVLYFVAHGVEVPPCHLAEGLAKATLEPDGTVFDWQRVLGGLFLVRSGCGKRPPPEAHVAVHYLGHWFWIDERDNDTKSTFSLLIEMSRLDLQNKTAAPLLTIPIGGR
ncbi:MAG: hypothetical protein U0797_05410 [Gemmataceae bacterium]